MMLKDIKGLMVKEYLISPKLEICTPNYEFGFNDAVDQQGLRSLTLDREKTAKELYFASKRYDSLDYLQWEETSPDSMIRIRYYEEADALIAHLPEILIKGED